MKRFTFPWVLVWVLAAQTSQAEDPANIKETAVLGTEDFSKTVLGLAFAQDDKPWLASTNLCQGNLLIWDYKAKRLLRDFAKESEDYPWLDALSFSPDGRTLAVGGPYQNIQLWDLATWKERATLSGPKKDNWKDIWRLSFSANSKFLASASEEIRLWDLSTGKTMLSLPTVADSIVFSQGGGELISGGGGELILGGMHNSKITVWDLATGKEKMSLEGHKGRVRALVVTPDGKFLVSGSYDGTIRLWDLANGRELKKIEGRGHLVHSLALAHDGKTVVADWDYDTLLCWDFLEENKKPLIFKDHHKSLVTALAISADDSTLASGGDEGEIRLWDLKAIRASVSKEKPYFSSLHQ